MARDLTDEEKAIVSQLRAAHGAVGIFLPKDELLVIRGSRRAEHDRWQDGMARLTVQGASGNNNPKGQVSISTLQRELALSVIVYPSDAKKQIAMLDASSTLAGRVANKANALADDEVEEIEGN